jgi:hypothetical protein
MRKEPIDYKVVIDDLVRKRALMNAQFDAAIAALQHILALSAAEQQPILPGLRTLPSPQPASQPYRDMGIVEASLAHLITNGPVSNLKLAAELEDGGFRHKSKNFPNTLNSVLWRRSKTIGDIRKTNRGWELASNGAGQKSE